MPFEDHADVRALPCAHASRLSYVAGVSPVPAQLLASPGADVGGVSPVLVQIVAVPAQSVGS